MAKKLPIKLKSIGKMKRDLKNNKGFTLIELLVVISIIGLLSSLAVVSLNSARVKARDALRKADMAQMRTALNLYYMDHNQYPVCGHFDGATSPYGATVGDNEDDGSWCYINNDSVLNKGLNYKLTSGTHPVIQEIPRDPKNKDNLASFDSGYIYRYVSDGVECVLAYTLEEGGLQIMRGW